MPMIDIGIKISIASAGGTTAPVANWIVLENCVSMPALIQPSSKIAVDYIGDEYVTELLGKRAVSGLDFVFAYDGTASGKQFKVLRDASLSDTVGRWMRIEYPDGALFEMLVELEVSLIAPVPSGELDYTLSVVPLKNDKGDIIIVTESTGKSPLDGEGSGGA